MRSQIAIVALLLFGATAVSIGAQDAPIIAKLQIDFWPEYDRPQMLVIYRGSLSPGTQLPAMVDLRMPARLGPPLAVAYRGDQGNLVSAEYETRSFGDETIVSIRLPSRDFQFEYYDDRLDTNTDTRAYGFSSTMDYQVQALVLQVQQPSGSTEMTTSVSTSAAENSADGLKYLATESRPATAGETIEMAITYRKNATGLSVEKLQPAVPPPVFPTSSGPGQTTRRVSSAVVLIPAGFILVVVVVVAFIYSGKNGEDTPKSRGDKTTATMDLFCHACGKPVYKGDKYCRHCGRELRSV